MTAITGADSIVILKKGSTWGTAVAGGTGDKVILESFNKNRDVTVGSSNSIGGGISMASTSDTLQITDSFSLSQQARYDDAGLPLILAAFLGSAGSPSEQNGGEGDYLHTLTHDASADVFLTAAALATDSGVIEFPSAYVTGINIESGDSPGYLTYSADFLSSQRDLSSSTNTSVTLASATVGGSTLVTHNTQSVTASYVWINSQSGGALSSGDAVCPSSFSINLTKPRESIRTFCSTIVRKTGLFEATVTLNFPRLVDMTWFTAHESESEYKANISIPGTQIGAGDDYAYNFYFPKLKVVEDPDFNITDPGDNGYSVTFTGLAASANPTGMSDTTPYVTITNEISTDILA